ncbi:MAG: hypothetical protein JWQ32_576 [Marmoricola sp.]|nr:hypothetical protein [Marmoricola sp.]
MDVHQDPRLDPDFPDRLGVGGATIEAVGKLSEAMETVEIARGHLYAFHQLSGHADFQVEDAVELLRAAGHEDLAADLDRELVGRNVLPGRWTFQVIEDYARTYYEPFQAFEERARALTGGHRHVFEAGLKRERRSADEPGHEGDPADLEPGASEIATQE